MERNEFKELLQLAKIKSKKEFAELTGLPYSTVNQWGTANPYPVWVRSWLVNYIELTRLRDLLAVREKLS